MGDWLSFLIFAGLFYILMRYGCGAHMIHGRHSKSTKENESMKNVDPVCGMKVEKVDIAHKDMEKCMKEYCIDFVLVPA